jgi:pre-mRNA-splicing factor ATP-dependent RNA helicase DHX16
MADAAAEREAKSWIQDKLHGILGFADPNVAAFLLSLARKHSNADSLFTELKRSCSLPGTPEVQTFAAELLRRVPRKGSGPTGAGAVAAAQARQARELVKKSAAYGLLAGDEDEEEPPAPAPAPKPPAQPASGRGGPAGPGPASSAAAAQQQAGRRGGGSARSPSPGAEGTAGGAAGGKQLRGGGRRVQFADGRDDDDDTVVPQVCMRVAV